MDQQAARRTRQPPDADEVCMTFEHVVALAKRGELTPTTAAEVTGLTVEEASEILAELAEKGQLRRMTQSDPRIYGLPSRDEGWQ